MSDATIIMIAPNGARKTHKDHPQLPVSIEETVSDAAACFTAGATVLHAHVRGEKQQHVLDAGLYRELIGELKIRVPELLVQITTEAVGIYTPEQQISCVQQVIPKMASVSLKEITRDFTGLELARDFFHWCVSANVHVQHIVYSAEELKQFLELKQTDIIPQSQNCILFVLGRYSANFQSSQDDLKPFLENELKNLTWFTCAFGQQEQVCLVSGVSAGGHARVGFENNLYLADGEVADSNAVQVSKLKQCIETMDGMVANSQQACSVLGIKPCSAG